jgi:hypothetical protein
MVYSDSYNSLKSLCDWKTPEMTTMVIQKKAGKG